MDLLGPAFQLQFGHGGEAVETEEDGGADSPLLRFNSATAVKPWRPSLVN